MDFVPEEIERISVANRWNIPEALEREIIDRDRCCVYCGIAFGSADTPRAAKPTWEHIVNDARIVNRDNIARCCVSCNASKGTKDLADWFESGLLQKAGDFRKHHGRCGEAGVSFPPRIDNRTAEMVSETT